MFNFLGHYANVHPRALVPSCGLHHMQESLFEVRGVCGCMGIKANGQRCVWPECQPVLTCTSVHCTKEVSFAASLVGPRHVVCLLGFLGPGLPVSHQGKPASLKPCHFILASATAPFCFSATLCHHALTSGLSQAHSTLCE